MNFETRAVSPDGTSSQPLDDLDHPAWDAEDRAHGRRRAWMIIAAVVMVALIAAAAWYMFRGGDATPAKAGTAASGTAAAGGADNASRPSITVMSPGRATVERIISATGTLAARREMPVGAVGEGGQILRVLVEPGQWVQAGQVLATVDRAVQVQQLEQLGAQIRVADADARLAQADLARAQALVGRGFISTADVERRTATRDSALARVRVAQAQLAEARARTGRLDIRAPAAGLVLTRGVEPGQVVSAGTGVLFRIARGGEMELLAQVGEADLVVLAAGARATVTPVGAARGFDGQIWQISPVVDTQSRQGTARIALAYAPGLRPGGFAEARIVAGAAQASLLPESAVMDDERGSYVFIIGADNKVERRAVTIGPVGDSGVPVISGLTGQEKIVATAGAFLNPGDVVVPVMQRRN